MEEKEYSEKNNLTDFLTYSYFGIVPERIFNDDQVKKELPYLDDDYEEYCIRKAIEKAYTDATNQGAYNALFKKDICGIDKLKCYSAEARKKASERIFDAVTSRNFRNETDFNDWHKDLCDELVGLYDEVKDQDTFFTYGNAQKWVNMTLKYIYLLNKYCGKYGEKILTVEKYLHIPLDSYMISVLKSEFGIDITEKWSKIKSYEDCIVNGNSKGIYIEESPIDWENTAWIKQAEIAKKSDKKKQYDSFWGDSNQK